MTNQWYCCIASRQYGPLPFPQLQQWVAEGRLGPHDHVCLVGQQQWSLARDVPGLFAPAAAYPQAPLPAPGPALNVAPRSNSSAKYRSSSRPKNDWLKFRLGFAVLAGSLALGGGLVRLIVEQNAEQEREAERAELRRRQQSLTKPKPPPINYPEVGRGGINQPKKMRTPRP